jgi:hypothetical protein
LIPSKITSPCRLTREDTLYHIKQISTRLEILESQIPKSNLKDFILNARQSMQYAKEEVEKEIRKEKDPCQLHLGCRKHHM